MPGPFPPIEPHASGHLAVGDGHEIYWEASGNPDGIAAVTLHGGPGGGLGPGRRRWFDPERYLLIQCDQRGVGRSTPPASDPFSDLTANTTHHLIGDLELLRAHLGVERWLVWGASWGVTLALAYAQRHPARVRAMVLLSVTNARRADFRWLYHRSAMLDKSLRGGDSKRNHASLRVHSRCRNPRMRRALRRGPVALHELGRDVWRALT